MMLPLALLALAAQELPDAPLSEAEIVVIAQRLNSITVNVGRDPRGRYHCALDGTTGRPRIDDRLCRATTKCVIKGKRGDAEIHRCVARAKPALLAELRKERRR